MSKRVVILLVLFATILSSGREKQENWIQVASQHFTVVSDGSEKDARRIADQFERMRLLFHTMFPNMQVDPGTPIVVIAVKDQKAFRALEPEAYLAKGQLQLAGLFLRAPDKNYVLLRMDATGEHPYATIYHEYTHLVLSKAEFIPLWLNEGLAEFYQNTDIKEKDTVLGWPSDEDIVWLRENRLLPLTTLLAVDHNSPYYHEEKKGSIFYAEAWALTHYLEMTDAQSHAQRIANYVLLLAKNVDPTTAAVQAFGDLKQLQAALERYIGQFRFSAFRLTKNLELDEGTFKADRLSSTQADAIRADFLAYNGREKDARMLLDQVLHEDPNNTLAHETMGYLAFRDGHIDQAQDWYRQAVKLNSQSYLANYYFAEMAMDGAASGAEIDAQIENSLKNAIKLNPAFAPAYDRLAAFYASRDEKLEDAHMLSLSAIQLEPGNMGYRINAAHVLLMSHKESDAINVLQTALKLAKTPDDVMTVQNDLETVLQQQSARTRAAEAEANYQQAATRGAFTPYEPEADAKEEPLTGPHKAIIGKLKNVRCAAPATLDFDVEGGGKKLALHAHNLYKVAFTALNFQPTGELQPCIDLEGMTARVEYIESASSNGILTVQLRK